ncbi:MAG: hypothetical protein QOF71_2314 [Candidatus Eremiobacteraeota bacterium]|jgi:hypothetical protein|nr:hypothetical protein [Candidatus Eremiobacteraeota bacterium]
MSAGFYTFTVRIDCAIRSHFDGVPTEAQLLELVTEMVNDGIEEHLGAGKNIVVAIAGRATPD